MRTETIAPPGRAVRWFHLVCDRVVARLPFGLARLIAPTFVGYLLVSGFTFATDLLVLTVLHGMLGLALPIAVTAGYVTAFALSYLLNRVLNFESHAALAPQFAVYLAVVTVNYLVFILGVTSGVAALGLDYRLARVIGALGEGLFMYASMRLLVFRTGARPRVGVD
ncbi:GtrA family protein [Nocardia seriolae]|uniref:Polysaccharide synthesis protein GtrA n=1 Tax=Nocardia seriolae TaxID=37332 RepID=A0A0B8N322_9NOCA|nr:GtrA family protein [Nocardia seriolae]MTJ61455.1 GtrA family protein [Nocardia seriolae]MTJ71692.1 GtrA family protein [Nocardia seriolae]MTJ86487.1 GtrA family protein [Nocardia seriolae]MTK30481.1 GtrA family protein [Nocardia seriolae]MTK39427.1 GtrA family protein [Nocardia seriolae]